MVSFFITIFVYTKKNTNELPKLKRDDRQDIAIAITNKLIELGYVPDCTDTDDESEFEVQDLIADVLKENNLHKKLPNNLVVSFLFIIFVL